MDKGAEGARPGGYQDRAHYSGVEAGARAQHAQVEDEKATEAAMKAAGVTDAQIFVKKLVSPAQCDKLYKTLTDEQAPSIRAGVTRTEGALTRAEDADRREAVSASGRTAADYPDESEGGYKQEIRF